jgi:PAS domain S-box-containing protein
MSTFTKEPTFDTNRQEETSGRDAVLDRLEELERRLALAEQSASDLSMVLDATLAGSWDWNIGTGEIKINERWAEIIGFTLEELTRPTIGSWKERCHPDDLGESERLRSDHIAGRTDSYEMELRMRHKDGRWIWVLDRGKVFERDALGNPLRMIGSHQEITGRKKSEASLESSHTLERLMTDVSNQFINIPGDQIGSTVQNTLQKIGEQIGADRCYVFLFSDDLRLMDNTHEWCADGIDSQIDSLKNLPTSMFPWWMEKIGNNEIIHIPQTSALPEEADAEKKILEAQHIQSLIVIPLSSGSIPFGYIGFDSVRETRDWRPEIVSVIKIAGGVVASALQRGRFEKIIQAELDLAHELNSTNSFTETLACILKSAMEVSGMDAGGVYLVDRDRKNVSLAYHEGLSQEFIDHTRHYSIESYQAELMLTGNPIYSTYSCLYLPSSISKENEKLEAIAILPVYYHGDVIGCLNIASRHHTRVPEFSRKALETIASRIGPAIINARHEQQVAEAKNNLETLFDTIEDFLFIVDQDGKVISSNAAVNNILGYAPGKQMGLHVLDFHPEELREEAETSLTRMLDGSGSSCMVPLKTASGVLVPVETKVTRGIWDQRPVLFSISRNNSDFIRSQRALVEHEQRFRDLTEILPLPIFEVDSRLNLTYANRSCNDLFGYRKRDLQEGFPAIDFCIPEDRSKLRSCFRTIIEEQGELSGNNEFTCIKEDGSLFPALFFIIPITRNGKTVGANGLFVDLSETNTAGEALRNSAIQEHAAREFKALIDNIPGAVYRISSTGASMLSTLPESLAEFSRVEYEYELFETMSMVHPDDLQAVTEANFELRSEKKSETITYRILTKQGAVRWIDDCRTSTFAPDGSFTGIDGILFDVTERIMAQEDSVRLESQLRKSQRLETIGTLAGGIAHDFNNILTPILGYAEMGVLSLTSEDPLHEYFSEIMLAAERAQNLVSQILTFSRAQESRPAAVSIQAIVSEALKLLRPSIPSSISIDQHVEKGCGNVLTDPSQIHQVVLNVCTNAIQAMEEHGGTLGIDIREIIPNASLMKILPKLRRTSYLQLSISDTGIGMDESVMERVFEPFFTTKSVDKGTGLGLSVVHGIIVSCNGEILVESAPGKGSTFFIYLPVIKENKPDGDDSDTPVKGSGSILFIDDEKASVTMMTIMLNKLGFTIQAVNSPIQALELFRENPGKYDLVITDLTMPEMTGLQLATELRKTSPDLPVILMTGYGKNIEYTMPLNRYGISKLLKKPVKLAQLASTVNELLFSNHQEEHS